MTIQIGDRLPSAQVQLVGPEETRSIASDSLFAGKRVVLFAVPGAFTPTCSAAHLPGFVVHADDIKANGADAIVCLTVNDAYVVKAWAQAQNVEDRIQMVADGNGAFTRAVGLAQDLSAGGMGVRSQRYAMIVEDGVVTALNVEQPKRFEVSSAEAVLRALQSPPA